MEQFIICSRFAFSWTFHRILTSYIMNGRTVDEEMTKRMIKKRNGLVFIVGIMPQMVSICCGR